MRIISTLFYIEKRQEDVFNWIASLDGLETFDGWFLIPSIKTAKINKSGEIVVQGPAGLKHKELVINCSRPEEITFLIYPNIVAKPIFRLIEEKWILQKTDQGTAVKRDCAIEPRKYSRPAVSIFAFFFKKAILKHNKKLVGEINRSNFKIKRPVI